MTFLIKKHYVKVTGIEEKLLCLCLNKNWQPIGVKTVKEAFSELSNPKCSALNIIYKQNSDGTFDFSSVEKIETLKWNEWILLPIRNFDFSIKTPRLEIRVPTILICNRYADMPKKSFKLTLKNIWLRDAGVCQYTGKKLDKDTGNIDHIISKSRGGENSWENMVLCHKEINSKKGTKTPEEAGLKLIKKPKALIPVPICETINFCNHTDWKFFIKK